MLPVSRVRLFANPASYVSAHVQESLMTTIRNLLSLPSAVSGAGGESLRSERSNVFKRYPTSLDSRPRYPSNESTKKFGKESKLMDRKMSEGSMAVASEDLERQDVEPPTRRGLEIRDNRL